VELPFSITYDGREAERHRIDMRKYGQALVGLDRIISGGLIVLFERRLPAPRERVPLSIAVSEPERGCVAAAGVVMAAWQGMQPYLPFIYEQIEEHSFEVIWTILGYVFKVLGGRENAANTNLDKLIGIMDTMDERNNQDKKHEREAFYADRQRERDLFLKLARMMKQSAKDVVGPLGQTASSVYFGSKLDERHETVDEPMASAIRSPVDLKVGDMEEVDVEFDGFQASRGVMFARRVGMDEGWIRAQVQDPKFQKLPNAYSEAASQQRPLRVFATPTYKDGQVHRLFIMGIVGS
jgi:hypothetical protein